MKNESSSAGCLPQQTCSTAEELESLKQNSTHFSYVYCTHVCVFALNIEGQIGPSQIYEFKVIQH